MNKEEILAMEAGDKLDEVVSRLVMDYYWVLRPRYSTNILAAWQIVDRLVSEYYEFQLRTVYHHGKWHWYCSFEAPEDLGESYFSFEDDTAPIAICKVALLAKLAEKEVKKE